MNTQTPDPYAPPAWPPFQPPADTQPSEPQPPWWQRDGVVSRILVLAGVGVTLVGVVLLLVLAAQNGLFGPEARVAGGAALSAGLVVAGWRVMGRPGGRIGGIALQATGFAGFYLDVLAVTTLYEWVAPIVGLVAALGIAVAGVVVAMRWKTQSLAVIVNVCCAMLAPALTRGLDTTLVAFLLVFAVVGALPEIRLGWSLMAPVRTLPVVYVSSAALAIGALRGDGWTADELAAAAGVAIVGVVTGLLALRTRPHDMVALITMLTTAVPAFAAGSRMDMWPSAFWYVGVAALFGAPGLIDRSLSRLATIALSSVSAAALLCAALSLSVGYQTALPLLALSLALVVTDLVRRATIIHLAGQTTLFIAAVAMMAEIGISRLTSADVAVTLTATNTLTAWTAVATAILASMGALRVRDSLGGLRTTLISADIALAMYAVIAGAVAIGVRVVSGADGYSVGQMLATAAWMSAAFGLLMIGLRHPEYARYALSAGLTIVGAALGKLFLFDLAELGGIARAVAFLAVGLMLLAAGTRYARVFAERSAS